MMKKQITRLTALGGLFLTLASVAPPAAAGETDLGASYRRHLAAERRQTARDLVAWSQAQGAQNVSQQAATLERGMAELGFSPRTVVTATLQNANTGQRHSVVLWFEGSRNPWTLDPTGALASQMLRMDEAQGWKAVEIAGSTNSFRIVSGRVEQLRSIAQANTMSARNLR